MLGVYRQHIENLSEFIFICLKEIDTWYFTELYHRVSSTIWEEKMKYWCIIGLHKLDTFLKKIVIDLICEFFNQRKLNSYVDVQMIDLYKLE
jgi:hypothetical protein